MNLQYENGKIGITQTIGAGYKVLTKVKWILGRLAAIKSQNYKHAKKSGFSETIARKIAFAPHLNIGVFSLEKNSECWIYCFRSRTAINCRSFCVLHEGFAESE